MRVLVFGADGFIGSNVCAELDKNHEVFRAIGNSGKTGQNIEKVDLTDTSSIYKVISEFKPQAIINCAGIVGSGSNVDLNITFTKNIIEQASLAGGVEKVVISGSAGEYGRVNPNDNPVNENLTLKADAGYGLSKVLEERTAIELRDKTNIDVIVLRIFNPIGLNMANRFLLTNLMAQIEEVKAGTKQVIELSRLDAKRDYVAVYDIATAFKSVIENKLNYFIYNVGSGISTTNGELLQLLIKNSKVDTSLFSVKETSEIPEPIVANMADISRITKDTGWKLTVKIEDLIKEIYL